MARACTDGQRRSVSIKGVSCSLQSSGDSAQVHQTVPPANQWQGRVVHPVGTARVGLWLDVSKLSAANPSPGELAAPLQLAPTAQRHRIDCPDGQAHPRKQPLDGSQPAHVRCRRRRLRLRLRHAPPLAPPGPPLPHRCRAVPLGRRRTAVQAQQHGHQVIQAQLTI